MKAVSKLVILLSVGALSAVVASATTPEQAYIESCRKDSGYPVPVAVVSPSVGPDYAGAVVRLEFIVDTTGKPVDLSVKSSPDDRLAAAVMDAVKLWRFKPAEYEGVPVETKVSLPVKIVDDTSGGEPLRRQIGKQPGALLPRRPCFFSSAAMEVFLPADSGRISLSEKRRCMKPCNPPPICQRLVPPRPPRDVSGSSGPAEAFHVGSSSRPGRCVNGF